MRIALPVTAVGVALLAGCDYVRVKPTFEVELKLSSEVVMAEEFTLGVDVKNPHGSAITLDSVDVDDKLLQGFQVVSVAPSAKDSMHVPLLNQRTWNFGMSVPAGSVQRIDFKLRPVQLGRFSGNVDACNPGQDCAGAFADVVVKPKGR